MSFSVQDWGSIVLIATTLLSLLKPLLESYVPGFKTHSANHDTMLRLLSFVFCLLGVLWLAFTRDALSLSNAFTYLLYTVQQWAGSQTVYTIISGSGRSIGNSRLKNTLTQALPTVNTGTNVPVPVAQSVAEPPATGDAK